MASDSRLRELLALKPRIILGSESQSRRVIMDELAREHGFAYETAKAAIDEAALGDRAADPSALVLLLARAKADAIRRKLPNASSGLLLTCDQVVVQAGRILEKPRDAAEARAFIAGYSQRSGRTVGSVVCTDLATGRAAEGVDCAEVFFGDIPADVTEALIQEGTVFQCAGGLMVEHPLVAPLITRTDGTQDSVMGLSKQLVLRLLLQAAGL